MLRQMLTNFGLSGGPGVAVMLWGCITFDGVGTLSEIEEIMNTTKYFETLGDNVWPVIAKNKVRTVSTSFTMSCLSQSCPVEERKLIKLSEFAKSIA